jgi:adenosylcobinamide kinase / adenosylcobinamide-phosphate guanylyltransferase
VDALLLGTGGADGWPADGCRCASCMRARSAGLHRAPGRVLVDGLLEFSPRQQFLPGTRPSAAAAYRITQLPGGWDITGPGGSRLLLAAGPGQVPEPLPGASPYDVALLDLLAMPAHVGLLRSAGLVHDRTAVAALYTDHRVSSEQEMARRCELWGVAHGRDDQLVGGPVPGSPSGRGLQPAGGRARPHRTLITGGARSGKSTEAELRLAAEPRVTYLAAGPWAAAAAAGGGPRVHGSGPPARAHAGTWPDSWTGQDGEPDTEWARRVAMHRARRPAWWRTVEGLDMAGLLRAETGAVLIDGIGTWLAGVMDEAGMWAGELPAGPAAMAGHRGEPVSQYSAGLVQARIDELIAAWRQTRALVVAVTDQVGSGLVPTYPAGRVFRDQLGWLNQRLAAESELNLLVVAGRVVPLPA